MNLYIPTFAGLLRPSSGWSPGELTNLYSWFDAQKLTSITKDGSNNVTQWADRSGLGGVMNSSGTTYPIYSSTGFNSRPALTFATSNGSELFFDNYLLDFLRNQTNITIIQVFTRTNPGSSRYMWYWSTGTSAGSTRLENIARYDGQFSIGERQADSNGYFQDNPNAVNAPADNANMILRLNCNYGAGQGYLYSSTYNDTTPMPSLNGFGRTTAVSDTRSLSGWLGAGTEAVVDMAIGEFILIRGGMTADEVTKLNVYLKDKWGL